VGVELVTIYTCIECNYTFERETPPNTCPECGRVSDYIREATKDEKEAFLQYRLQRDDEQQAIYRIGKYAVKQILLPDPNDTDPHPRWLFDGYGIHAGQGFTAWLPDGWREICLEISWEKTGPQSWYIPKLPGVCPVGLWCRCE
jgi:hypothetical protein